MRRADRLREERVREILLILQHEIFGSVTGIKGLLPRVEDLLALIPPDTSPIHPTRYTHALRSSTDRLEFTATMLQILAYSAPVITEPEPIRLGALLDQAITKATHMTRQQIDVQTKADLDQVVLCRSDYIVCAITQAIRMLGSLRITISSENLDNMVLILNVISEETSFPEELIALYGRANKPTHAAERGSAHAHAAIPFGSSEERVTKDTLWLATIEKAFRLHGGGMLLSNQGPNECLFKFSMLIGQT